MPPPAGIFFNRLSEKNGPSLRTPREATLHAGRPWQYSDALAKKNEEMGRAHVTGAARGAVMEAWQQTEGEALRPRVEDRQQLDKTSRELVGILRRPATGENNVGGSRG